MTSRFASAFATVSGLTGLSRVLGFVRDQLLAVFVGPGVLLDAWLIAFSLPNAARRTFAEGAMSAAFVPLLREHLTGSEMDAKEFARSAFSFLIFILTPLITLLIFAMPWIIGMIAQEGTPDKTQVLAIIFGRIMLPYLLFMSLMALVGGVLDALGRFAAKAAAPTAFNLVMIGALSAIAWFDLAPGAWLSWATLLSGALQLLVVWIPAARMGWAPTLVWPRGMGLFVRRTVPGIISRGGYQISFLVVLALASTVEQDVSYRYLADRVYQLPLGLIGIALNTVLLSSLANLIADGKDTDARYQLNRGLELAMLLALPITTACIFQSEFLFEGLFEVGRFSHEDSRGAGVALLGFSFGIPAAVGQMVVQPAFFARSNTDIPMFHSLASVVVAISLSYILYPHLGLFGLALAASASSWVGFISLSAHGWALGYLLPDRQLLIRLIPMLLSAILMAIMLGVGLKMLGDLSAIPFASRVPLTLCIISVSGAIYFTLTLILGGFSRSDMRKMLRQS